MAIGIKDLYWAAGFLDGEGCFCFSKPHKVLVQAVQLEKELLERLQKLFGGVLRLIKTPEGKPCWQWSTSSPSRAVGIMFTLFSLLSLKRQGKIKKVVAGWKTIAVRLNRPDCPHEKFKTKCLPCLNTYARTWYYKNLEKARYQAKMRARKKYGYGNN